MGEKLSSPPLIEAICEFRFGAGEDWDGTLPGRLYDRIASEFPERAQVTHAAVHVELRGDRDSQADITRAPDRVQLTRDDGSAMVQIGPNLFAVNHLRPYPSWQDFRGLILRQLGEYLALVGSVPPLTRLGLRYINRLQLPEEGCNVADFTTLKPPLEGVLDQPLLGFYQRYELLYETPRGTLIHQTGIQAAGESSFLMIDLDFGSLQPPAPDDPEAIGHWLDQAHDRVHEGFVKSLNPDLYQRLREGDA